MKTYFSDIIPKIQKFSQKLDDLTLLTNQNWVVLSEIGNAKIIYIFRSNQELLISQNGKVEKAKWEYLGNNSLLIDRKNESYLFKHGFFDENILALKIDGIEEYAFLINESKYDGELNSLEKIIEFLTIKYIHHENLEFKNAKHLNPKIKLVEYETDKGVIKIPPCFSHIGQPVYKDGKPAPDGKYRIAWLDYIHVLNGMVIKKSMS